MKIDNKGWWHTLLQIKRKTLYKVYIRELNRVLSINYLSYIYWADSLCYTKSSLSYKAFDKYII